VETGELYLGLISGTSADGIDVALVDFAATSPLAGATRSRLVFAQTYPWPEALRARLVALGQRSATLTLDDIGELDTRIGREFAAVAAAAIVASQVDPARIRAIGSHGQTLRHRPSGDAPFTLQLGDPNTIAERCRIATVADFRRRDIAAGGHGAPLMPAFHAAMLGSRAEARAVLNLGGIANLTLLAPGTAVRGFDTGPANGLMDAWCLRHTGHAFDLGWLEPHLRDESAADVQATLVALSARTIADALRSTQPRTRAVIVCGGGVHNPTLLDALATELPSCRVESSAEHGMDPDFVEAMGFAWLARETLAHRPGNLPSVSGAQGLRVLGAVYAA
jgi:anhydro-N-acetylmuramic acid kinase